MACEVLKLNRFEILGSSFPDRKFKFLNRNIVNDSFKIIVYDSFSKIKEITGLKSGNEVSFAYSSLENLKEGTYTVEFWVSFNGIGTEMIANETMVISSKPICVDWDDTTKFSINFNEEIINFTLEYNITNITTGGTEITPIEIKQKYESNTNTNAFTDLEKSKLEELTNYNDSAIVASLQNKVDKVSGKQLSTNDYTTAEKDKLAGLDSNKFKGKYTSLVQLQSVTGEIGAYAYVGVPGSDDQSYIWDNDDNKWVLSVGMPNAETPASIKLKYESNPDTNAFTNTEKSKLDTAMVKDFREIYGTLYQSGGTENPQFLPIGPLEIAFTSFLRTGAGEYTLTLAEEVDLNKVFFQNSVSFFESDHPVFQYGEMFLVWVKAESTSTELKFVSFPSGLNANFPNVRTDGANNASFYLRILN